MAYFEEFRNQLQVRNYQKVLQLWEEYCLGESAESEELAQILTAIRQSEFAQQFSSYALQILPQVLEFKTFEEQIDPLRAIYDLQTQDTPELQEIAIAFLKKHFETTPLFNEKLRLVGLRGGSTFQGALTNFYLLHHMQKNNFVLHTAGWGAGEIMDVSFVREQASIEFENLNGAKRDISFKNAFKTLLPISKEHFLSRRFADADRLEKDARSNPDAIVRLLLESLGPRTAAEIKNEIVDYVIPEADYSKWWQQARSRLKKDPFVDVPENNKETFRLRKGEASWQERMKKAFKGKHDFYATLAAANTLIRDFPELTRNAEAKNNLVDMLNNLVNKNRSNRAEEIQVLLFMENALGMTIDPTQLKETINNLDDINEVLAHIEILSLKKRFLDEVREYKKDWADHFLKLLFTVDSNQLKDYLLKELSTKEHEHDVKNKLKELITYPKKYPETFAWYFNKIIEGNAPYLTSDSERYDFLEGFLILLSHLESNIDYKEFVKKMANLLTQDRFALARAFFKNSTLEFAKEFLLLISKCHTFTDHDKKIFQSLAEVVHQVLAKGKKSQDVNADAIWTTEEGLQKTQERIKHIGTVEMIDVAREIEAARALGDLRENAEFKSAQERRSRLQAELKQLSDLFHKARIIRPEDIQTDVVSIGSEVTLKSSTTGKITCYTILGPWDADTEKNILSFQSKLAQEMIGKQTGDTFSIKDEEFTIAGIRSYLQK